MVEVFTVEWGQVPCSTEVQRWAFLGAQTLALNGSVILAVVPLLRASKRSSRLPLLYRGL